jgi:hypothetical protein
MGTRTSTRFANCYVRIRLVAGIAPSRPGAHLPRIGGIALATDLIILIVHPSMGDTPWRCSVGYPTAYRVLG